MGLEKLSDLKKKIRTGEVIFDVGSVDVLNKVTIIAEEISDSYGIQGDEIYIYKLERKTPKSSRNYIPITVFDNKSRTLYRKELGSTIANVLIGFKVEPTNQATFDLCDRLEKANLTTHSQRRNSINVNRITDSDATTLLVTYQRVYFPEHK